MSSPIGSTPQRRGFFLLLLLLGVLLLGLFSRSFSPGYALRSNDGPLAVQASQPYDMPGAFLGIWNDNFWLGTFGGNYSPNITGIMLWILGPYGFVNFHVAFSLIILGLCAWVFFRQLGFSTVSCVVGGMAAALNGNFFSNAAWGLSSRALCLAMTFLALAAVESSFRRHAVLKTILAGLAVGMSVSEGADNGAIFSLFVSAYAVARAFFEPGTIGPRLGKGIGRVGLMAVCAAIIAAQSLNLFVNVAVKGVVNTQQERMTPEQKWDFTTQWSLPKLETLRVIIPGLYGYLVDPPDDSNYWGTVGRTPGWETHGQGIPRHSGAGEYAGVIVALVAFWAMVQSLRKTKPIYTPAERRLIWFWVGAALVAMVLGWGRHAPFYKVIYSLPYFSTIRNPMKFMHAFHMALMILFAYGLYGLSKRYLQVAQTATRSLWAQFKISWKHGDIFEKRWIIGSLAVLGVSLLAFLVYSTGRANLVQYLTRNGFAVNQARDLAAFSASEVGWFFLFLALSVAAVFAIQSGWFGGRRAKWAGVLLGLILVADLARANTPWIIYYNYRHRYARNPVIDLLAENRHQHRVAVAPFQAGPQLAQLQNFYHVEWLQHHFQYYNIQAIDMAQEPRLPEDKAALLEVLRAHTARYWQLTNTRYLLGLAGGFVDALNQQISPGRSPFRQVLAFELRQTPEGYSTAITNTTGPFAVIENTEALPRAKLYYNWQVITNGQAALERLAASSFDPATTVVVSDPIQPPAAQGPAPEQGSVEITSYTSRGVKLSVSCAQPAVLLLNDRYDPRWVVEVDGEPQPLLQCNFIMRGVALTPGQHTVRFVFVVRPTTFYITLGSVLVGLGLCLYVVIRERRPPAA